MKLNDCSTLSTRQSIHKGEIICRLCGSVSVRHLFTESSGGIDYANYYCSKCDLYQTLGDISAISPDYIDLRESDIDSNHYWLQTGHKKTAFRQWSSLMHQYSSTRIVPPLLIGSVMDIGCGVGGFLDYASSQGLRTYGFDASKAQVKKAQKKHHSVRCCTDVHQYLSEFELQNKINYVTMWDVFEHIREPQRVLSGIHRCLDPDGLLYISVPNGASTMLKLYLARFLRKTPGLIPWEHVFYYTKRSLRVVLEKNGFIVKDIGAVVAYPRHISMHEIIRRSGHLMLAKTRYAFQIYAVATPR